MAKPAVKNIPDVDHVARHVSYSKIRRNGDRPIGVLFTAFELREGENYLSASWVEHDTGDQLDQLVALMKRTQTKRNVGQNSGFAVGNVRAIKEVCSAKRKIRVVNEPKGWNAAYTAVRQFPGDELEVLELLASDAWSRLVLVKDLELHATASSGET